MTDSQKSIYTKDDLIAHLRKMNAPRGGVVLVHGSLRSVGQINGGGEALLDALIEYFTEDGGILAVATHTWLNLGKEITLDLGDSKTSLGALANIAAADPRGIRTRNPSHSVALFGDKEKCLALAEGEDRITTPTSAESFYGKLYKTGGHILLIGVGQERNTYLHSVEEMLAIPDRMGGEPYTVRIKDKDGRITEGKLTLYKSGCCDDVSLRFPKFEEALRYHRAVIGGYIGNAYSRVVSAVGAYETLKLIYSRAEKDPLADESQISPKLYVL